MDLSNNMNKILDSAKQTFPGHAYEYCCGALFADLQFTLDRIKDANIEEYNNIVKVLKFREE